MVRIPSSICFNHPDFGAKYIPRKIKDAMWSNLFFYPLFEKEKKVLFLTGGQGVGIDSKISHYLEIRGFQRNDLFNFILHSSSSSRL